MKRSKFTQEHITGILCGQNSDTLFEHHVINTESPMTVFLTLPPMCGQRSFENGDMPACVLRLGVSHNMTVTTLAPAWPILAASSRHGQRMG